MGKRLSKIYTRTGDAGETGLGDGSRISKTHERVEAMGAADELNSAVGLLIEYLKPHDLAGIEQFLAYSQHRIFDLGGELSIPGFKIIEERHVSDMEVQLDALNKNLAPLENFILPGGSQLIAHCHMARSICRRAERRVVALAAVEDINPCCQQYLNRLSDYLFVLARYCAAETNVDEVIWQKDKPSE